VFRIRRLGVVATATVAALVYLLLTFIILLPFALILATAGPMTVTEQFGNTTSVELSPFLLLLLPFVYAILGWILTAIFCLLYNLAASITGGAEIEVVDERPMAAPPVPPAQPMPPTPVPPAPPVPPTAG
jgi:hypothetical protein